MNFGTPELLIILIFLPLAIAAIGLTIWGLVDAGKRGQTGWLIGIVVGWAFGFGWLIAVIYLTAIRPGLVRASSPPGNPFERGWG